MSTAVSTFSLLLSTGNLASSGFQNLSTLSTDNTTQIKPLILTSSFLMPLLPPPNFYFLPPLHFLCHQILLLNHRLLLPPSQLNSSNFLLDMCHVLHLSSLTFKILEQLVSLRRG